MNYQKYEMNKMMMAMPDPNGTGQLYLQPLIHQLQLHPTTGGAKPLSRPGNTGVSEGGPASNTNMFMRQRSNAVSIRARRNKEQENRSR